MLFPLYLVKPREAATELRSGTGNRSTEFQVFKDQESMATGGAGADGLGDADCVSMRQFPQSSGFGLKHREPARLVQLEKIARSLAFEDRGAADASASDRRSSRRQEPPAGSPRNFCRYFRDEGRHRTDPVRALSRCPL